MWSYERAIHLVVDLGSLEDFPTDTLPGFTETLLGLLPGLREHSCSRGRRGGFVERLTEGTWLGHVTEHVALQLQQEVGHDLRRGKTRQVEGERGRYNVIYGYVDEQVGLAAAELAVRLVNHLVRPDPELDFEAELESFIVRAERTAFGPSTQAILDEAVSRDIPWIRLNKHSLVQLGQGVHQKRVRATMTSQTSSIAVDVASDKDLTTRLLNAAGLPVPKQDTVRSADQAVRAARRIGFPVVVKPLDGNHGRGVCINLRTDEEVREAYDVAEDQSRRGWVIVESYISGRDYRCLVIDGRIAAIAERVPASVTGDGRQTIRELVDETNADPRRGVGHEKVLTRIRLDEAAEERVHAQGFTVDDVPPEGTSVKLALTGNMSTGGISIDRTFEAHPENVEIAEEAARVIGLDIAGIDFICPDIVEPVRETGGAICEVNAAPGFRMHTHPTVGDPQFISKPVVDMLFPPGAPSRIPIVAVTGTNGKTTTARMISHIFKGLGPQGRHDVDRRHRDRRAAADPLRRVRSQVGPDGAAEPAGRLRRLRGRARRHPARGARLRAQRRRRRAQRAARPPRPARHRHRRAARRRQGGRGRGGAARRLRGAQRRRPARPRDAPQVQRRRGLVQHRAARQRGQADDRDALPPWRSRGRARAQ